jgi:hypothetical protein
MSFKVALSPHSFTPTENISSMSSSGLQVNKTPPLVRARGKAINGLIGEKTKWNSALSPTRLPRNWDNSNAFWLSSLIGASRCQEAHSLHSILLLRIENRVSSSVHALTMRVLSGTLSE